MARPYNYRTGGAPDPPSCPPEWDEPLPPICGEAADCETCQADDLDYKGPACRCDCHARKEEDEER